MLVLAVLALSAMPPFGIFRSEFYIVEGGLSEPHDVIVAIFVMLVIISFFGLSWFTTETMLSEAPVTVSPQVSGAVVVTRGEVSYWIVAAMAIGLVALVILGVHPPSSLMHLLDRAAAELGSVR
jgi:hydrogenase-4 component F